MTTWLLAIVLMASVAALGYRQGAIRVAISFVGIIIAALLAAPLGGLLGKLLGILGMTDPLKIWVTGPLVVFVLINAASKAVAAQVHQKADVYYKYHAGDLRFALWERLNHRLGLCLGLANGAAYLILIAFVIYVGSYATVQVTSSDTDPRWMRLTTRAGKDLHATGFAKVAASVERVSDEKYKMADFGGMLYHNPLVRARLTRYPGFLGIAELPEFQAIGDDEKGLMEPWQRGDAVLSLLETPSLQAVINNPDLLKTVWNTVTPAIADLNVYLDSGVSPKYESEKILGRWIFDANATISLLRRARSNIPSTEMQKIRLEVTTGFARATAVAMPDNRFLLKNVPSGSALQTVEGKWESRGGKYVISLGGKEEAATFEGGRLVFKRNDMSLAFSHDA